MEGDNKNMFKYRQILTKALTLKLRDSSKNCQVAEINEENRNSANLNTGSNPEFNLLMICLILQGMLL